MALLLLPGRRARFSARVRRPQFHVTVAVSVTREEGTLLARVIPAIFTDAFKSTADGKCIVSRGYVSARRARRQKFLIRRATVTARWSGRIPRNVAIRLTGRGNGFLMVDVTGERRGRTISLVMETACRGNRQQPAKGRYIHKGGKGRVERKGVGGRRRATSNERMRERERKERVRGNLPTYPLSSRPPSVFLPSCRSS